MPTGALTHEEKIPSPAARGETMTHNQHENEKAFAQYYFTLHLISTRYLTPYEASQAEHEEYSEEAEEKLCVELRERLSSEPLYQEYLDSLHTVPYYNGLLELLVTDPTLSPTEARDKRMRYILTKAVIENRIQPSDIALHDSLFSILGKKEDEKEEETQLEEIEKRADPKNDSHRLAIMYAKRRACNNHKST